MRNIPRTRREVFEIGVVLAEGEVQQRSLTSKIQSHGLTPQAIVAKPAPAVPRD